ncbi:unnamed protein product [Soboliphyme baturini]|uniref:CUE domain-containing protein n=1 Tax=Soboliphyme baturini TaxID=241478 RepID=A0A183J756_9BILA|nr:unnamed protein product [Soboliphyme baturini]
MFVPVGNVPYSACAAQPTVVPCTAEDVKELKEMFPNIEEDVIRNIFEEKHGNKEAIVNDLLALSS